MIGTAQQRTEFQSEKTAELKQKTDKKQRKTTEKMRRKISQNTLVNKHFMQHP
ncbi:hypothetical protein [uncultured Bacteroides sp.]|uniref:hypothetical protein n=1 Tax=uncultured Bacteroides sp. TaxID=162156 RepID=UPI0026105EBB|nr:hypothetical protein [uncultured Bacteroides sp.]